MRRLSLPRFAHALDNFLPLVVFPAPFFFFDPLPPSLPPFLPFCDHILFLISPSGSPLSPNYSANISLLHFYFEALFLFPTFFSHTRRLLLFFSPFLRVLVRAHCQNFAKNLTPIRMQTLVHRRHLSAIASLASRCAPATDENQTRRVANRLALRHFATWRRSPEIARGQAALAPRRVRSAVTLRVFGGHAWGAVAVPLSTPIRTSSTSSQADRASTEKTDASPSTHDQRVRRVAEALQSVLQTSRTQRDASQGRVGEVTWRYAAQALTPLLFALSDSSGAEADDAAMTTQQQTLLRDAWRASGAHFYWKDVDPPCSVAIACDWQRVVASTALQLPCEGVTEGVFVQSLLQSLSAMHGEGQDNTTAGACRVPESLEGANGSLAHWVSRYFSELVLVTRSASQPGESLYRCTHLQQLFILSVFPSLRAGSGAFPRATHAPPLRGPEREQLVGLCRALDVLHGGPGAADLPVWTALSDVLLHTPSAMPRPSTDTPHAWTTLLSAPALRPYLSLRARVRVRARGGLTDQNEHTHAVETHRAEHAAQLATPAHAPVCLCVDLSSLLPAVAPDDTPSPLDDALKRAVQLTGDYASCLMQTRTNTAAAAAGGAPSGSDGGAGQSVIPFVQLVVLAPRDADRRHVEQALLRCVHERCPGVLQMSCVYVSVDLDDFLGSEHVLGATLAQHGTGPAPPSPQSASPDCEVPPAQVTVLCGEHKVAPMRAVLASLPGTVEFITEKTAQ